MNRQWPFTFWYMVVAMALVIALQDYLGARAAVETIPYSQFEKALAAGDIAEVSVSETAIEGAYRTPGADGKPRRFKTVRVPTDLSRMLADSKVVYRGEPGPGAARGGRRAR